MFIDAQCLEKSGINSDICIVGAGVAGITITRELANTKFDIAVLESGSFDPDAADQSLISGTNSGLSYYDLEETRDRAFGGTSNSWRVSSESHNVGNLVRLSDLDAIDFEKRDWVPYSGWPFSKSELIPYYERAQEVFNIGPYRYDTEFWDRDKLELKFKDRKVRTKIFQFGRKDVFTDEYRYELKNAENIKVYLNTTALKLKINEYSNRINSITATTPTGKRIEVNSQHFILAMGGLENPRIMLLSNGRVKNGIGNQHDLVGRFFMEHPHLWSGVFYPSNASFFDKSDLYRIQFRDNTPIMGKLRLSQEVLREERLLNMVTSLHLSPMEAYRQPLLAIHEIVQSLRENKIDKSMLSKLKAILSNPNPVLNSAFKKVTGIDWISKYGRKNKYHGYLLNIMSEQVPNPESRITLGRDKDCFGQNKIELNWKLNSLDIDSIKRFQDVLNRELRNNRLGYLDIDLKNDLMSKKIHGGYHHMGTTRMDTDPKGGVVDENCRVHGIDNLFVSGSSVFPTVGYANPTLTIVAMAIRLADYVKQNNLSSTYNKRVGLNNQ